MEKSDDCFLTITHLGDGDRMASMYSCSDMPCFPSVMTWDTTRLMRITTHLVMTHMMTVCILHSLYDDGSDDRNLQIH